MINICKCVDINYDSDGLNIEIIWLYNKIILK